MALAKVKTTNHGAGKGKHTARWDYRAIVKHAARKRRRHEAKILVRDY